ncbi:MAG: hypothetical protein ACI8QC_000259 [Planctomycetota bacterium]
MEYDIDQPIAVIGRAPGCDVIVNHPYVSGRHLRILCGVVVEDLGSSNGTFLNDQRIEGTNPISDRRITVGGPEICLEVFGAESAPPEARAEVAGESALLAELLQMDFKDFKDFQPRLEGSVTDFYLLESFRLLRQVEKVVTRMAGELTTKLKLDTLLPGVEGNFMALMAEAMKRPSDTGPREELVEYLGEMRKWLFVSLGAYQRASVKYAEEIRSTLSPTALAQSEPVPPIYRWFRQEEKLLWRRAKAYLDGLSRTHAEERLDALAKASAREMIGRNGRK